MKFDQCTGQRQAQTKSFDATCSRFLDTAEAFERNIHFGMSHALAAIGYREEQATVISRRTPYANLSARRRELDCVAQQIDQNLSEFPFVRDDHDAVFG